MIELPLILVAGVLGSSHCVGMCGGFALTIGGSSPDSRSNLRRQVVYSAGRLFTYATLGAVTGFGGLKLASAASHLINIPSVLATVAGGFLLYQGLAAAGVLKRKPKPAGDLPCLGAIPFASLLTSPTLMHAFLAGLFTGLLPCGLLYGMLSLAASTQNVFWGMTVMAVFGAGTIPVMVLTGYSGSLLSLVARRHIYYWAAWCVVLTGCITMARGLGFLALPGGWVGPGCPACG